MTSNVKISIKDGDTKVKISIDNGKMKIRSIETNNRKVNMNAIKQLVKEIGSVLKGENEDSPQSQVSINRPTPEEVENKIKEETKSKDAPNFSDLVDDFTSYLFKYGWENVVYEPDEHLLKAYLGSDITIKAKLDLDNDTVQITFDINTASTITDTTFRIGTGFKKKRGLNILVNSSGRVLTLEYKKTDIDYTKETYDSIISDFKEMLKAVNEEKETLLGEGTRRPRTEPDPYLRPERAYAPSLFPSGFVCYYGCPNSNKVVALQTKKKKK